MQPVPLTRHPCTHIASLYFLALHDLFNLQPTNIFQLIFRLAALLYRRCLYLSGYLSIPMRSSLRTSRPYSFLKMRYIPRLSHSLDRSSTRSLSLFNYLGQLIMAQLIQHHVLFGSLFHKITSQALELFRSSSLLLILLCLGAVVIMVNMHVPDT